MKLKDKKNFDSRRANLIDQMNLEQLTAFFKKEHMRSEDLENYALRAREKKLRDEKNQLIIE